MFRLVSIFFILLAPSLSHAIIPVEHFSKHSEYDNAVISPNGEYLAIEMMSKENKNIVAILRTKDMSLVSYLPPHGKMQPFNPVWVTDKRYVVELGEKLPYLDYLVSNGELVAANADGKNKKILIRNQYGVIDGQNKFANDLIGFAEVLHILPEEPNHILISFRPFGFTSKDKNTQVYKLSIKTAKARKVVTSPSKEADFVTTPNGEISYSFGFQSIDGGKFSIVHKREKGKWHQLSDYKSSASHIKVLSALENPDEIYIREKHTNATNKIYKYNTKTEHRKLIFKHPEVNPSSYTYDRKTNELLAIHFDPGYPDVFIVNPDNKLTKWYQALFPAFGGQRIKITSSTDDGSLLVIHVTGASEPGQFHLFDTKTKSLRYILNAKKWLNTKDLAITKPYSFKTRDGQLTHGYITLPKGKKESNLPMVVVPHGGPHTRDYWQYDDDIQFIASRGYAVLQVNFRGSAGYGYGFGLQGDKNWGTKIQYDIIDATKWAIDQGYANKRKICLFGGSFGGYSALMAPTIDQGLYQCAVGLAGVYDLELMWKTADTGKTLFGENYLRQAIGKDKEKMRENSPLHNIDKLTIPVFLAHGGKDWRVDVKHYKKMVKALKDKNHPHETMLAKKEGHGFYKEKNRREFFNRLEKFLAKHIGN